MSIIIEKTTSLPTDFELLTQKSELEGFRFLRSMTQDWCNHNNRFDKQGEFLLIAAASHGTVAVCGVNIDPYLDNQCLKDRDMEHSTAYEKPVARLRHLYCAPAQRGRKIGSTLVLRCIESLDQRFDRLRLRVPNEKAGRFYEALGFTPTNEPDATHNFCLK